MKQIQLTKVSKRFLKDTPILSQCSLQLNQTLPTVVKGKNGSGKSTLLQIILGIVALDEGEITYSVHHKTIQSHLLYQHFSYTAPCIEIVEDFTVLDFFNWLAKLRTLYVQPLDLLQQFHLEGIQYKFIRNLSSGMHQRIKLLQAFFCKSDFLLLDEPCMNFDDNGYHLYQELIQHHLYDRLLLIASNDHKEFDFEHQSVMIEACR